MLIRRGLAVGLLAVTLAGALPLRTVAKAPSITGKAYVSVLGGRDSHESIIRRILLWIFDDLGEPKPS